MPTLKKLIIVSSGRLDAVSGPRLRVARAMAAVLP
jgi:hypothetical protein